MVVQLREIIGTALEEHVFRLIEAFSCRDSDVESFIKSKAFDFEKRNKSRTYLILSEEKQNLLAYYTLSLKTLELDKCTSKTTVKEIDGFNKNASSASVILIG